MSFIVPDSRQVDCKKNAMTSDYNTHTCHPELDSGAPWLFCRANSDVLSEMLKRVQQDRTVVFIEKLEILFTGKKYCKH